MSEEIGELTWLRRRMRERVETSVQVAKVLAAWAAECSEEEGGSEATDSPLTGSPRRQPLVCVEESLLSAVAARSRLAHYVYTPLLFSPAWRAVLSRIRRPQQAPSPQPEEPTPPLRPIRKSSAGGHPLPSLGLASSSRTRLSSASHQTVELDSSSSSASLVDSADAWHFQIQHLLMKEYSLYLESLGLRTLKIIPATEKPSAEFRDPLAFDPFGPADSPTVWLVKANSGGAILLHLSFSCPYFGIRFYVLDPSHQLPASLLPPIQGEGGDVNGMLSELVSRCHLHSFSYDFHLKMVVSYLTDGGSKEVMFRPGYHMDAFLIDFLQYYHNRPAFARNSLYEDDLRLSGLEVSGTALYNHLLDHDRAYSLRVVRMKIPPTTPGQQPDSDYLLLNSNSIIHQKDLYQVMRILLQHEGSSSKSVKKSQANSLHLKFYVVFVSERESTQPVEWDRADGGSMASSEEASTGPGQLTRLDSAPDSSARLPAEEEAAAATAASDSDTTESDYYSTHGSQSSITLPVTGREHRRTRQALLAGLEPIISDVGVADPFLNRQASDPQLQPGLRRRALSGSESVDTGADATATAATVAAARSRFSVSRVEEDETVSVPEIPSPAPMRPSSSQKLRIQRHAPRRHRKSTIRPSSSGGGRGNLEREQVTYVAYVAETTRAMQKALEAEAEDFRLNLRAVVAGDAAWHCRRDQLWTGLLATSARVLAASRRNPGGWWSEEAGELVSATADEVETLLGFVTLQEAERVEPALAPFLSDLAWPAASRLLKTLLRKYGAEHCRLFADPSASKKYLVVLNPNWLDSFMLLCVQKKGSCRLWLVYKDLEALENEPKIELRSFRQSAVEQFFADFVKAFGYDLWQRLLL